MVPASALALVCLIGLPAAATGASDETATPGGIRTVELGGVPVEASTDRADPTVLQPGLWRDVLGAGGSPDDTHYYAYRRQIADSTIHLAVTSSPDDPDGEDLAMAVVTAEGETCGDDSDTVGSPVFQSLLGVGVTVGPDAADGGRDDPCVRAAEVRFTVSHSYSLDERAIALRVVEEAPTTGDLASLPAPPKEVAFDLPRPGEALEEVAGSASFADAPTLSPGALYRDRVDQGAVVVYRVSLDWGQSLAVRADIPLMDAADQEALEFDRPNVALTLLDPFREVLSGQVPDDDTLEPYDDDEAGLLVDGTAPVAYRNRFARVAAIVPGDYFVSLAVQPGDPEQQPVEVPIELTVGVSGEPGEAPSYPALVVGPGGTEGPEGYAAETPYLVGPGVFTATVSGDPGSSTGSAGVSSRLLAGLIVGAVSFASAVAGAWLLRRRPALVA